MIPIENNYSYYKLLNWGQAIVCCLSWTHCLSDLILINNKNKLITNVRLSHIKPQKGLQLLKFSSYQNFTMNKLVKNIILRNFSYVTFSQKVNIKRDI